MDKPTRCYAQGSLGDVVTVAHLDRCREYRYQARSAPCFIELEQFDPGLGFVPTTTRRKGRYHRPELGNRSGCNADNFVG